MTLSIKNYLKLSVFVEIYFTPQTIKSKFVWGYIQVKYDDFKESHILTLVHIASEWRK